MDCKRFFDRLKYLSRADWIIFSLLAAVIIFIFCWVSMSWRASSLAHDLTEYVNKHNPLDEFGMTAKVSNSWDGLYFEILSQEPTGKILYDDYTYESAYDFTGYNGLYSGYDLEKSGVIYLMSSYLVSLPQKEARRIIDRLEGGKIKNSWLSDFSYYGYDRLITKYDSIKTTFIRNVLIFDVEIDFNEVSGNGFIYRRLIMEQNNPVLEFDYVNPLLGKVRANGLSEEASEFLVNAIKSRIEEEKRADRDHVNNFLKSYFRTKILKSISEIDIKDILKRSECDSVVIRLKESRHDSPKAYLGFNLTDSVLRIDPDTLSIK